MLANESDARRIADTCLERAGDRPARVLVGGRRQALSRLGANVLTQQVEAETLQVTVEIHDGQRCGRAVCGTAEPEALRDTVDAAAAAAAIAPEDSRLQPPAGPAEYAEHPLFHAGTAAATAADRVAPMAALAEAAKGIDGAGAGSCETAVDRFGVYTSAGAAAFAESTVAAVVASATAGTGAGWAAANARDWTTLPATAAVARAVEKAVTSRDPTPIEPGRYTVILEPAALAEMLFFAAYLGFGARAVEEGHSFLCDRLGEQVMSEAVTIRDDAAHPIAPGLPFDAEGTPRQRLTLIDRGMAAGLAHDRRTAAVAGVASTGHATGGGDSQPIPMNLVIDPGTDTLDDLIGGCADGLLVTQLHYVNVVDPRRLLLTGMTRNGTFRIEHGQVTHPVTNLRFTESFVEAMTRVEALGDTLAWHRPLFGGAFSAPAARVAQFHFTSATDF